MRTLYSCEPAPAILDWAKSSIKIAEPVVLKPKGAVSLTVPESSIDPSVRYQTAARVPVWRIPSPVEPELKMNNP